MLSLTFPTMASMHSEIHKGMMCSFWSETLYGGKMCENAVLRMKHRLLPSSFANRRFSKAKKLIFGPWQKIK
jgi:hypothetical protein